MQHRLELPFGFDPRTIDSLRRVSDSSDPSALAHEIEETRERLAHTIDQLMYRAKPKTIVSRAGRRA